MSLPELVSISSMNVEDLFMTSFIGWFRVFLEKDCKALSVNGESLWNGFDSKKSFIESLKEKSTRNHLVQHPHDLFHELVSKESDSLLVAYFDGWALEVTLKVSDKSISVCKKVNKPEEKVEEKVEEEKKAEEQPSA